MLRPDSRGCSPPRTRTAAEHGWTVRRDGAGWRRVLASPEPQELVELPLIRMLMVHGLLVVCAGGGDIPVAVATSGELHGVDAVVRNGPDGGTTGLRGRRRRPATPDRCRRRDRRIRNTRHAAGCPRHSC